MQHTFPQNQRLKGKTAFTVLFKEGHSAFAFPVICKFLWVTNKTKQPFKVAFVVPKKRQRLAVRRHKIKRQMTEAFRLNKHLLNHKQGFTLTCLFIYVDHKANSFETLQSAMLKTINYLNKH
jgi:ribonuclease P protein component